MKKSEIIKKLIVEDSSYVQLDATNPIINIGFSGCYTPIQAIRLIRILPCSFRYDYLPLFDDNK